MRRRYTVAADPYLRPAEGGTVMRNAADPRLSTPIQRLPEFSKARRWRGQRATLPRRLRGQPRVTRVTLKLAYEVSAELQCTVAGRVMSPNLDIPLRLENPKIGRVDDAEIVGNRNCRRRPSFSAPPRAGNAERIGRSRCSSGGFGCGSRGDASAPITARSDRGAGSSSECNAP